MTSSVGPSPATPLISPAGRLAFGLAAAVVTIDQASKYLILNALDLPSRVSVPLLPVLSLTMVWNPGVSFGLLKAEGPLGRMALAAFAAAVVAGLAWWARSVRRPLAGVALGLVMGGAVGNNLIDRLRFGRVVDFIDVSGIGFFPWVFNVADVAINIGVALLILDSLLSPSKPAT